MKAVHRSQREAPTMLLFAALALLTVASSQVNALNDGDEGVCHEITTVTYTDHESREVTETLTEWCWNAFKGFRCEVPYTRWEIVPVTKERQVNKLVCCEGYELQQGICMRPVPLETTPLPMPETTPAPVPDHEDSSSGSDEEDVEVDQTPAEASPETTPQETTPVPAETTRGFLTMEDIEVASDSEEDGEAATESIETTPVPADTKEEKGLSTMKDVELAPEPSEESSTSFNPTLAPIVILQVDQERNNNSNNNNNNKAEENAIIKFLASQTSPPAPAATKEAASAAEAAPDAVEMHNNAKAEAMAAEAIGIFAKEIIKSLGDPITSPEEESVPGDLPSTDQEPTSSLGTTQPSASGSREGSGRHDEGAQRDPPSLDLSPAPGLGVPAPQLGAQTSQLRVIDCLLFVLIGFLACLILLLALAAVAYVIYNKRRHSHCEITAIRPVVVP